MYAIIEAGGKQYKIKKGSIIEVEKLSAEENKEYLLDKVLLIKDNDEQILIGQPYLKDAKVKTKVLAHDKDKKVVVFKYKRKTGYRRKNGHRQPLTRLEVQDILL